MPQNSVNFGAQDLSAAHFLALAGTCARKMDWTIQTQTTDGFIAYTPFSKRAVNEKISIEMTAGLGSIRSQSAGGQFFDWGKNKKNIVDFLACFDALRNSLVFEEPVASTKTSDQDQILVVANDAANIAPPAKKKLGMLSLFVPVPGYFITPILIDLNILVFVLAVVTGTNMLHPDNESLLLWGANFRPRTLAGEPWRLLTNCFVHIGIVHLLFNMYALAYIGILLEPRLGFFRFATVYLLTGITASIASLYWHPLTISAGASGAIFGMYGVFLAMLTTNLIEKSQRKPLLISIGLFVAYNLLMGMKGAIDNAAHTGGRLAEY